MWWSQTCWNLDSRFFLQFLCFQVEKTVTCNFILKASIRLHLKCTLKFYKGYTYSYQSKIRIYILHLEWCEKSYLLLTAGWKTRCFSRAEAGRFVLFQILFLQISKDVSLIRLGTFSYKVMLMVNSNQGSTYCRNNFEKHLSHVTLFIWFLWL